MDALIKNGKRFISFIGLFFLFTLNANANPQVFLDSDFTGVQPSHNTPWVNVNYIDPNYIYSGWNLFSNGLNHGTAPDREGVNNVFAFYVCGPADGSASTLAYALADNHYIRFSLSPQAGSIDLNSKKIVFKINRLGFYWAPRDYAVFTNIGGFQEGNQLFTTSTMANGNYSDTEFSFIMPGSGYDNIPGSIEFRIYAYGTKHCYSATSLTDFRIEQPAPLYDLSLSGTSGGTVTSIPQGARFEEGTNVQLIATPDAGYHFAGWSGDVSGKGNPRTITMTSSKVVTANFAANVDGRVQVGMNLAKINDWSSSDPFVDVFKMFRTWTAQDTTLPDWQPWDSGKTNEIPTDTNGWPTHLPFTASDGSTQYVHTILTDPLPGGDYHIIIEGVGKIKFRGPVVSPTNILNLAGGITEFTLQLPPNNNGSLQLLIYESLNSDPVRNIKIIRPGYTSNYQTQIFQPPYLNLLQPFVMLRLIDWGKTIDSPIVTWGDRTLEATYTQTRAQGVALEYMVELANTLQKDLWINIPHKADDNYVRQAARLLRDTVGPDQKIYVEYSNETWNGAYSETTYVQDQGQALNLDSNRWIAGNKFTALRSVQIWKIFQEEFGADARVRRVLATQVSYDTVTLTRLAAVNDPAINPDYLMPDVLAIAPYFGHNYTVNDIPPNAANYPTVDEILNVTAPASIAEQQSYVRNHKAIADAQGVDLVCYEAGQHFVGVQGAQNDTTLTNILIAANRDARMYQRYADYLAMLDAEGVSRCIFYADIERPSNYGSWGVLEYLEQPVSEAPKYRALVDFINGPADLSVSSVVNPSPAYLNDVLTYTFTVVNYGPSADSSVVFTDTLPAGVSFVSAASQGGCANASGTVTCNLGSLASGASTTVTITVTATATGTLSNTATVSGSGTDPNPANNSTTVMVTVNSSADLSVSVNDTPDPALIGDTVAYTIMVTNNGPSPASGVILSGTLPSCSLGTIASGASASCTRTITATAAGTLSQTVSASAAEYDINTANNTATASTSVLPSCSTGSYKVTGAVRKDSSSGSRIAGATLRLSKSGCGNLLTTTATKDYSFTGLNNGTYTVVPSKTGCTFTPISRSITVNNGNVSGWSKTGFAGSGVSCTVN